MKYAGFMKRTVSTLFVTVGSLALMGVIASFVVSHASGHKAIVDKTAKDGSGAGKTADLKVTIKEWAVPTKGAHPHDPAVGADGALWFTEQMANKIGRLDPATGTFKEYSLIEGKNSGPHGLVADKDGNIWYTANFGGYIGKLDPHTGKVTEYKMPD